MKSPMLNLILKITVKVLMTLIALALLLLGGYFITQPADTTEEAIAKWVITCCTFLFGIVMLPYYSLIVKMITRNTTQRKEVMARYIIAVVNVLRTEFSIILVIIGILTFKEWGKALDYIIPIPVSEKQMKAWERQIASGDVHSVSNEVYNLNNYKKRVNIYRLAAKDLKSSITESRKYLKRNDRNTAKDLISSTFNRFDLLKTLKQTQAGKYDHNPMKKYFSSEEIADILVNYTQLKIETNSSNYGGDDNLDTLVEIIKRISPSNSKLLLLQADRLWYNNQFCDAKELYRQYVDSISSKQHSPSIQSRVKEITSLPKEWSSQSIESFFKIWMKNAKTYYFSGYGVNGSEPVKIDEREYGAWGMDVGSLPYLFNSELEAIAWLFVPGCKSTDEQRNAWEKISKHRVEQTNPVTDQFTCYNSGFVDWIVNNAIPEPTTRINSVSFQILYNRIFKDWIRTFAFCYKYLENQNGLSNEAEAYRTAYSANDEFYGSTWLSNTYSSVSMANMETSQSQIPVMIGIWLRRSIDGSAESFWNGLKKILTKYDKTFLDQIESDVMQFYSEYQEPQEESYEYDEGGEGEHYPTDENGD